MRTMKHGKSNYSCKSILLRLDHDLPQVPHIALCASFSQPDTRAQHKGTKGENLNLPTYYFACVNAKVMTHTVNHEPGHGCVLQSIIKWQITSQ